MKLQEAVACKNMAFMWLACFRKYKNKDKINEIYIVKMC